MFSRIKIRKFQYEQGSFQKYLSLDLPVEKEQRQLANLGANLFGYSEPYKSEFKRFRFRYQNVLIEDKPLNIQ